jgi:hypothetical protein
MVEKIRKGKEKGEVSPMGQMPLSIIQDGPFQAFISSIAPVSVCCAGLRRFPEQ